MQERLKITYFMDKATRNGLMAQVIAVITNKGRRMAMEYTNGQLVSNFTVIGKTTKNTAREKFTTRMVRKREVYGNMENAFKI